MAVLRAKTRTETGKRAARLMRKDGLIPAVVYGHGQPTVSVTLNEHDVELAIQHGERILEIRIGNDKMENVLIKDIQWDTFGQVALHVDLTRVDLDELIRVTIPIVLRGTPAGAVDGGIIQQTASEVEIEVAVRDIPDDVRISVAPLVVGDTLVMSDLALPDGAKLLTDPGTRICALIVVAEEVEAEAEAEGEGEGEGGQPEVIGGKPEEDGEEAGD